MSQFQIGTIKLVFAAAVLFSLGTCAATPNRSPTQRRLSPVIFIPGNGGSQLEAKVDSSISARTFGCEEREGWFRLWLNVWEMILGKCEFALSCYLAFYASFYFIISKILKVKSCLNWQ